MRVNRQEPGVHPLGGALLVLVMGLTILGGLNPIGGVIVTARVVKAAYCVFAACPYVPSVPQENPDSPFVPTPLGGG
jgi:hypothetical protein